GGRDDGALANPAAAAAMRREKAQGRRLLMKTLGDLLDDWEAGVLTEADVSQLKTLLQDAEVRAQVRSELCFYGLLNDVLKTEVNVATAPALTQHTEEEMEEAVEWDS